ncbi:MAG: PAS domain S-box protein [Flavobacterium sp. JAD_PAG50586_2]|nr:MAG: PAS domain S-box protein [Flavobacterium sp. JAD_PAG50586_2]
MTLKLTYTQMFFKYLFTKPLYAEPYDKSCILFKIIWSVLLVMTVSTVISIVQQPTHFLRYIMASTLLWGISLIFLYTLRKYNVERIATLYISFLLLLILGFSFTGGGIKAHGIRILPMVVLLAGLTIGRKTMWIFAVLVSLGGLSLVLADYYGMLPMKEAIGQSALSYWIYSVTGILLLCYMENLSVERFNHTVDKFKKELNLRKQSDEKYKAIFESFQDVYYQTDMSGIVTIVTPSIKKRAGYDPKEIIGNNVVDFYHQTEKRDNFVAVLLEKGYVHNYELELRTKDGKIKNVLTSSNIVFDKNKIPIAIEGTLHDITQRKKNEELLKEQNQKLMRVAHLQSHIVRKPIANVIGIINLLDLENPNDPTNLELIPQLETASRELDTIISEIVENTSGINRVVKSGIPESENIE